MKQLLLICLLLTVCLCPGSGALRSLDTFEFGINMGQVIFTTSGSMGLFEKVKRVSIVIPDCADLKYVRVEINNRFGPPSVKFDWTSRSVIMEYTPLQFSVSQYTISAKGLSYCNPGSSAIQKQLDYVDFVV